MTAKAGGDSAKFWKSHYDSMAHHKTLDLFDAEASDYFMRLQREIDLASTGHVLDFGCGLGFVSRLLAENAGRLSFWDYSSNMLDIASSRLAATSNAQAVDLGSSTAQAEHQFDLIVVNSVIQYMSRDDLKDWLRRWRMMLAKDGSLVISDIILPTPAFITEVLDSLKFAARGGFLWRSLKQDFKQYARYLKTRKQGNLSRYSRDEFRELAREQGFECKFLSGNLTYRSNRFSVRLRPSDAS